MEHIDRAIDKYLSLRRSTGERLRDVEFYLRNFSKFMLRRKQKYLSRELAVAWVLSELSSRGCGKEQRGKRYTALRMFSEFWAQYEPRMEALPRGPFRFPTKRKTPYIFSSHEIRRLLRASRSAYPHDPYKRQLYYTLFGLIAVTGMRHGEAIRLKHRDFDFKSRTLSITSKNRTRNIVLHPTTTSKLQSFLKRRQWLKNVVDKEHIFVARSGHRISIYASLENFRKLLAAANITGRDGLPTLIHLRHSFAVNTLISWYKKGWDVNKHILYLSAYLGHDGLTTTYWYLTSVPELTSLAAARLEAVKRIAA